MGSCNYGYYSFPPATEPGNRCYRGKPDLIETIGKAAIATGADGIFIETHPDPSVAYLMEQTCLSFPLWKTF